MAEESHDRRPEDSKSFVERLCREKLFSKLNEFKAISDGYSGAAVYWVDLSPTTDSGVGLDGEFILKSSSVVDDNESNKYELILKRSKSFAAEHSAVVETSGVYSECPFSIYQLAGLSHGRDAISLDKALDERLVACVELLSRRLLDHDEQSLNQSLPPTKRRSVDEVLSSWLGKRVIRGSTKSTRLFTRYDQFRDNESNSVSRSTWRLVDPVAAILNTRFKEVSFAVYEGILHGDLHLKNIFIPDSTTATLRGQFWLIDYGMVTTGPLLYDHAYAQVAILCQHPNHNAVAHRVLELLEGRETDVVGDHVGRCLSAVDSAVEEFIMRRSARANDIRVQWLLAKLAAGLNWANKPINDNLALGAYEYAAHAATELLTRSPFSSLLAGFIDERPEESRDEFASRDSTWNSGENNADSTTHEQLETNGAKPATVLKVKTSDCEGQPLWVGLAGSSHEDGLDRLSQLPYPFCSAPWFERIFNWYRREAGFVLRGEEVFDPNSFNKSLKRMLSDQAYVELAGESRSPLPCWQSELNPDERSGDAFARVRKTLYKGFPDGLRIAVSPAHCGAHLVLRAVRELCHFPIEIEVGFSHSVDLLKTALDDSFYPAVHGFTLTLATLSQLFHEHQGTFQSFARMPDLTHGILSASASRTNRSVSDAGHEYLLMGSIPSSELFMLKDALSSKKLVGTFTEATPQEVTRVFAGDAPESVRSIIGFPHYKFNAAFNGCLLQNDPYDGNQSREVFLVTNNHVIGNPSAARALNVALRHAWNTLRYDHGLRDTILEQLLLNPDYARGVCRATGIGELLAQRTAISTNTRTLSRPVQTPRITVELTTKDTILDLRHSVLHPERPLDFVNFPGDEADDALHFAAFTSDRDVIGCVSLLPSFWSAQPAWRMRAMAVHQSQQGKRVGYFLLEQAIAYARIAGRRSFIWCDARVSAQGFYQKLGWLAVSEQFNVEGAGPTIRMLRPVD